MWSPEDHVFRGGKTLRRSPSPTSFLLRAGLLASSGSDQPTQILCFYLSRTLLNSSWREGGALAGYSHPLHSSCEVFSWGALRAKAQHAAIWQIYRNTSSLYTFPALFSEASLSTLCNINAHIHCSYFKVHTSCYEVSISPFTAFKSGSL